MVTILDSKSIKISLQFLLDYHSLIYFCALSAMKGMKVIMKLYNKEIVTFTDIDIDDLYIGCLPSYGRYFVKQCNKINNGIFGVTIEIPEGDLYYHFFCKEEPQKIFLDVNNVQEGAKSWHSIARIGTKSCLPFDFKLTQSYISRINQNTFEVKAIISHDWVNRVDINIIKDNKLTIYSMEVCYKFKGKRFMKVLIPKELIYNCNFYFKIYTNDSEFYYGSDNKISKQKTQYFHINSEIYEELNTTYNNYIDQGVVYHIFPDSFNRGSKFEKDSSVKYNDWGNKPVGDKYYGGTIHGIIEKLDYLSELGINTIYITPVFTSTSNHRYNSENFRDIDRILGDKAAFKELVEKCHLRGIKVIMDIILNHCATDFWAFKDVINNQENSKFKDWFIIKEFPVDLNNKYATYSCWWNNKSMPQFNLENKEVVDYLLNSCSFWVSQFNIDGWRIDVSGELNDELIKKFIQYMRKIKEDIIIIGENWKNSNRYLQGSMYNGVTNYLLWWRAFIPFFSECKLSVREFINNIIECYFLYPHRSFLQCWNLISSHDVARFKSKIFDERNLYIVVLLQILLPGTPTIYYGDEIGMEGLDDPYNRGSMKWEECNSDNQILNFYKDCINLRNSEKVFVEGCLKFIDYEDNSDILIMNRYDEKDSIYVIVNLSDDIIEFKVNAVINSNKRVMNLQKSNIVDTAVIKIESKKFIVLKEMEG